MTDRLPAAGRLAMKLAPACGARRLPGAAGFTVVEILVSLAIAVTITGVVFGCLIQISARTLRLRGAFLQLLDTRKVLATLRADRAASQPYAAEAVESSLPPMDIELAQLELGPFRIASQIIRHRMVPRGATAAWVRTTDAPGALPHAEVLLARVCLGSQQHYAAAPTWSKCSFAALPAISCQLVWVQANNDDGGDGGEGGDGTVVVGTHLVWMSRSSPDVPGTAAGTVETLGGRRLVTAPPPEIAAPAAYGLPASVGRVIELEATPEISILLDVDPPQR